MLEEYESVLTPADLQEILNLGRSKVYALLQSGEIPAMRIGKQWRIPKSALLAYLGKWKA